MSVHADVAELLRARVAGNVMVAAPLGALTTFRVGGTAAILVEAESDGDLLAVSEFTRGVVPVAVIGRGSNLLVADEGFAGVAVRLGAALRGHARTELGVRFGGAAYLPNAAKTTARLALSGFEFAAEIPGSFGGAVRMNAGAHGRSMADVLVSADVVDLSSGRRRTLSVAELGLSYRRSVIAPGQVVTGGEVRLEAGSGEAVSARIREHLDWRRAHQPGGRSAGSMFKNPPGDSAGRLIDAAGLKGARVGGVEVSVVHANFFVTAPGATATEVLALVDRVRETVVARFGIQLELEVQVLGHTMPR